MFGVLSFHICLDRDKYGAGPNAHFLAKNYCDPAKVRYVFARTDFMDKDVVCKCRVLRDDVFLDISRLSLVDDLNT